MSSFTMSGVVVLILLGATIGQKLKLEDIDMSQIHYTGPKQLSDEETHRRVVAILNDIDDDDDGIIEEDELREWITEGTEYADDKESFAKFDNYDKDDDDRLSLDELLATGGGLPQSEKNINEFFEAADEDDDGELTYEEYHKYDFIDGNPKVLALKLRHVMANLDKDGDGKLSAEEVKYVVRDDKEFDREDMNDDGYLDRAEVEDVIYESIEEQVMETMNELMAADDNGDGQLSIEELLEEKDLVYDTPIRRLGTKLIYWNRITLDDEQSKDEL